MVLPRAALLIDAENLPQAQVAAALEELEKICNPVIRKAFGDFRNSAKNWEADFLNRSGITQVQHSPVSRYKNGADIAMCIAAMDALHKNNVKAIVLFSSDSDFSALATRIRDEGVEVIGIGDGSANDTFKKSFSHFIVVRMPDATPVPSVRSLQPKPQPQPKAQPKAKSSQKAKPKREVPKAVRKDIIDILSKVQGSDEAVLVSKVSVGIKNHINEFTPKKYGFASISKLLNSMSEVVLSNGNKSVSLAGKPKPQAKRSSKMNNEPPSKAIPTILRVMKNIKTEDDWYRLAAIGSQLFNNEPEFDYTKYGSEKLADLLVTTGQFEIDSSGPQPLVRRKPQGRKKATK